MPTRIAGPATLQYARPLLPRRYASGTAERNISDSPAFPDPDGGRGTPMTDPRIGFPKIDVAIMLAVRSDH